MRKQLKLLVPFMMLMVLLLSGCELQRGGEDGDDGGDAAHALRLTGDVHPDLHHTAAPANPPGT